MSHINVQRVWNYFLLAPLGFPSSFIHFGLAFVACGMCAKCHLEGGCVQMAPQANSLRSGCRITWEKQQQREREREGGKGRELKAYPYSRFSFWQGAFPVHCDKLSTDSCLYSGSRKLNSYVMLTLMGIARWEGVRHIMPTVVDTLQCQRVAVTVAAHCYTVSHSHSSWPWPKQVTAPRLFTTTLLSNCAMCN